MFEKEIAEIRIELSEIKGYLQGTLPHLATKEYVTKVFRGNKKFRTKLWIATVGAVLTAVTTIILKLIS